MPSLRPHLSFPLSHTRPSGKVALALAALLVILAVSADAGSGQTGSAYNWRQRVIVLLPGVCAQPANLPPRPDLPAPPLLPPPPDHWPDWPGWLTCGGEHAIQSARGRALGVFTSRYVSPAALTDALNMALGSANDGLSSAGLPFSIQAIEPFSYAGLAPDYESGQTRQPLAISARALEVQFHRWLQAYPGATFDLLGHSLGGAIAAYWAASVATANDLRAIHSIITLDSPLSGFPQSAADKLFLPFFGAVAHDLLAGSPAVSTIARAPDRWSSGPGTLASPIVTITNVRDYIVPFPLATIPGAVLVADDYGPDGSSLNHGAVLTAPAALTQVAEILAQPGLPLLQAGG